jgi:hypothetical protein
MTTTPEGLPAWLHVGAEVGTYQGFGLSTAAREATVARFTKTSAVLDNGDRFPLRDVTPATDHLTRRDGGHRGWNVYLAARDNDQFQRALAEQTRRTLAHAAKRAFEAWERNPADETARAAIKALQSTLTAKEARS